ncbi:MAG: alpha/beta fold hydrolase [Desulfuromonadaceae bacterium]|nr:alpha/beta fold hydrolase [Desulfuromonadaceae bacterium]
MGLILDILFWLVVVTVAATVLTFSFSWYEAANANPSLMDGRFHPRSLFFAFRLIASQACAILWSLLLRPAGWFMGRGNSPVRNDQTPIVLLHGLFENQGCLLPLKRRLQLAGFLNIHSISLPSWHNAEYLTERVAKKVDELRHATGLSRVHLIGHSMGGILARNFIQIRGGEKKVASCVLIGVPNEGSRLAPFALSPLGRLLIPESEFLRRLAESPLPPQIPMISIYSRHDNFVQPAANAHLAGAVNVELRGLGHTSLLYSSEVHNEVISFLRRLSP